MFERGDKVKINPNATKRDFDINACPPYFMDYLDTEFEVIRKTRYEVEGGKSESVYKLQLPDNGGQWWVLERCLLPPTAENEL